MEAVVGNNFQQTSLYIKDKTIDDLVLMGSPVPILTISLVYLVIVLKLGPAFMKKRPAYQLKTLLLIYNIVQVAYSVYLVWTMSSLLFAYGFIRVKCEMDDPKAQLMILSTGHLYLIAKVSELLETVFFVLRKKQNQVSFLHVYHHTTMTICTWGVIKYAPSLMLITIGALNSLVHVFMYAYYGLSAFPSLEKYLWWKKYLTSIQLIQFMIMIVYIGISTAVSECSPSYMLLFTLFSNIFCMIYLFRDFYLKSYVKKKVL